MNGDVARIAVVGAGPVGLATALAILRDAPAGRVQLQLYDAGPPPEQGPDWDPRVFALSPASRRLMQHLGAWEHMPSERVQPYPGMVVWDEDGALSFDAAELGESDLGCIVENSAVRAALSQEITAIEALSCQYRSKLNSVEFDGYSVIIGVEQGDQGSVEQRFDLLIGADGVGSAVRRLAGLEQREQPHHATAIVAHLGTGLPHGGIARQRFHPDGPLALLPLADGRVSLVWSAACGRAEELLALDDPGFMAAISEASETVLGEIVSTTPRVSFPLVSRITERPGTGALVLIGDAAHTVHPLAGQGANLGLLDAAALAEVVVEALAVGESPGARRVLRRFHRRRDLHNRSMATAFAALDRGFRSRSGVLTLLRRAGLSAVDAAPSLKHAFARRAMGSVGDLPRSQRRTEPPLDA